MIGNPSRNLLLGALAVFSLAPTSDPARAAASENTCAPVPNQVMVRFTYGSEKEAWIDAVTEGFNRQGQTTTSGKRICVQPIPKGSGESVNEIKDGRAGPDEVHATSPASDLYVNLINYEAGEQQGAICSRSRAFSSPRRW